MARFLSTANRVVATLSENTNLVANNRSGYAAAAAACRSVSAEEKSIVMGSKSTEGSADSSSWVPDPVTGYYRPANRVGDVDPAEMRAMLLSNKSRH